MSLLHLLTLMSKVTSTPFVNVESTQPHHPGQPNTAISPYRGPRHIFKTTLGWTFSVWAALRLYVVVYQALTEDRYEEQQIKNSRGNSPVRE